MDRRTFLQTSTTLNANLVFILVCQMCANCANVSRDRQRSGNLN